MLSSRTVTTRQITALNYLSSIVLLLGLVGSLLTVDPSTARIVPSVRWVLLLSPAALAIAIFKPTFFAFLTVVAVSLVGGPGIILLPLFLLVSANFSSAADASCQPLLRFLLPALLTAALITSVTSPITIGPLNQTPTRSPAELAGSSHPSPSSQQGRNRLPDKTNQKTISGLRHNAMSSQNSDQTEVPKKLRLHVLGFLVLIILVAILWLLRRKFRKLPESPAIELVRRFEAIGKKLHRGRHPSESVTDYGESLSSTLLDTRLGHVGAQLTRTLYDPNFSDNAKTVDLIIDLENNPRGYDTSTAETKIAN